MTQVFNAILCRCASEPNHRERRHRTRRFQRGVIASAEAPALLLSGALLLSSGFCHAATFYVKTNGSDAVSGASWSLAKASITNAMSAASAGDQIWVASGIYTQLVTMKASVALYGGFNGTETALAQRNPSTNLSWIYGAAQGPAVTITTGSGSDTRVDGMAITAGGTSGGFGGGISCSGAGPVIANNFIFQNAVPSGIGGGIYINFYQNVPPVTQPIITNNIIYANTALGSIGEGGGILVRKSSPLIAWNKILFNIAGDNGGGIACYGNCQGTIANNIIEANACSVDSMAFGGGILATVNDYDGTPPTDFEASSPVIVNNVVAANGGYLGGGIALVDASLVLSEGAASVINNTVVANTGSGLLIGNTYPTNNNNVIAFNSTGLELLDNSPVSFHNNDVYGNSLLSSNTDYVGIPNATGINGNISADPQCANYKIGDMRLEPSSPCINAGWNAAVVPGWPDRAGNPRIAGGVVDIGAYESTGATLVSPTVVMHVSPTGSDANDGLTWATAKRSLAAGIAGAAPGIILGGEVWVAQGIYSQHVLVPAFVYLYGGFAGTETNRAARNIAAYPAIVDGGGHPSVVQSLSAGYLVSTLDGFTVQNGGIYTDGQSSVGSPEVPGGGILCQVSSPILANNVVRSNSVGTPFDSTGKSLGGGIYLSVSHAQILNNTITHNDVLDLTAGTGGGIYAVLSMPTIAQNFIFWNHAAYGAAINFDATCSFRLTGNNIITNFFYDNGGFPYNGGQYGAVKLIGCNGFLIDGNNFAGNQMEAGGGLYVTASDNGVIQNNIFNGNLAYLANASGGMGGGIYCEIDDTVGNINIVNNTIFGNNAPSLVLGDMGGGVALNSSYGTNNMTFANNIIVSNSGGIFLRGGPPPAIFRNNCVANYTHDYYTLGGSFAPGLNDIHADPRFTNSAASDFHLLANSPCIDAGTALAAPLTDKDGTPRPLDGKNSGVAAFDIGAYEYVNPNADTDHDGMPDWAELVAGTDPTNPNSFLKLQTGAPRSGGSMALSWLSVTGRTYTVQFKSSLAGGTWQTLTNNLQGTGTLLQCFDSINGGSNLFYRLGVTRN